MSTADLFGKPTFLAFLPGETLFSLISRHHYFLGNALASQTCNQFFGHRRGGSQHDFPSHLENFVARTDGCFGSTDALTKDRTLLAFYRAFLPIDICESAQTSMSGSSVAHLKLRLGILTSRFRANHPLKACESCMEEDCADLGWTYWHLEHQYPGNWVCKKHGTLLQESTLKASGVERFQWHLPAREHFRKLPLKTIEAITNGADAIQSLSRYTIELVAQSQNQAIDTSRLYGTYLVELEHRGWVTPGGNLRMSEIAASYLKHVKPLQELPELAALPSTLPAARTELGRMLRPPRSGTHPLRHLVLINWLFRSTDEFWSAYVSESKPKPTAIPQTAIQLGNSDIDSGDQRHSDLVRMLTVENLSVSKSARALGIDVTTAMSWAARAGLTVSRRPKKLSGDVRRVVISELKRGADKAAVAKLGGVSVVTITKLLLTEVGLHAQWTRSRTQSARQSARQAWTQLLQTHGRQGIKIMREIDPASYAWLYRNDRVWLDEHKPDRLETPSGFGAPRVLWDARDVTLSQEIAHATLGLRRDGKPRRLRLWQIYQAVPELKAKLASLDRLPLTRRAIDQALSTDVGGELGADLFQ